VEFLCPENISDIEEAVVDSWFEKQGARCETICGEERTWNIEARIYFFFV
jgi:hypothetical protein